MHCNLWISLDIANSIKGKQTKAHRVQGAVDMMEYE